MIVALKLRYGERLCIVPEEAHHTSQLNATPISGRQLERLAAWVRCGAKTAAWSRWEGKRGAKAGMPKKVKEAPPPVAPPKRDKDTTTKAQPPPEPPPASTSTSAAAAAAAAPPPPAAAAAPPPVPPAGQKRKAGAPPKGSPPQKRPAKKNTPKDKESKHKGVSWIQKVEKWQASIWLQPTQLPEGDESKKGRTVFLGYWDTEQKALEIYDEALQAREGGKPLPKHLLRTKTLTSKHFGVSLVKRTGKFTAAIRCNGKQHYVGTYTNEDDAKAAYDRAAKQIEETVRSGLLDCQDLRIAVCRPTQC